MMQRKIIKAILFDLDGTLIDSAPTFVHIINQMLAQMQQPTICLASLRPLVSQGADAMLTHAFKIPTTDAQYQTIKTRFATLYEEQVNRGSNLFAGIAPILDEIEDSGCLWGVVTNKIARFTIPLLTALGITQRCAVIVCGDSTAHLKPHPAPLHHACEKINIAPEHCIYIGDAQNDIEAGRQAAMHTIAVAYGYYDKTCTNPAAWRADHIVDSPGGLHQLIKQFLT